MFAAGIVLAITLLAVAGWLHRNETIGWIDDETIESETDYDYFRQRQRLRRRVNLLLAACGILILVATFAEPGLVWAAAWTIVAFALFVVAMLGLLDALRTHRFQQRKLDDLRRKTAREFETPVE